MTHAKQAEIMKSLGLTKYRTRDNEFDSDSQKKYISVYFFRSAKTLSSVFCKGSFKKLRAM